MAIPALHPGRRGHAHPSAALTHVVDPFGNRIELIETAEETTP